MPFDMMTTVKSLIGLKPKKDPFKLSTFIKWLDRKPDNFTYNYADGDNCLCAQYFREHLGENVRGVDANLIFFEDGSAQPYPSEMNIIARGPSGSPFEQTAYSAKATARREGYL